MKISLSSSLLLLLFLFLLVVFLNGNNGTASASAGGGGAAAATGGVGGDEGNKKDDDAVAAAVAAEMMMMRRRRKMKKEKLLKTKLENYHKGEAVIINIHITHQAGTLLRQQSQKSGRGNDGSKFAWLHGENRSKFLMEELLPEWDGPIQPDSVDYFSSHKTDVYVSVPDYASPDGDGDDSNSYLLEYYKNHPNPNTEIYKTDWSVLYDKHNTTFLNWWESSGNNFAWSYHPWPLRGNKKHKDEYSNDPFISHIDWESPHVIAIIVLRNPMDRLLACVPKCLKLGKNETFPEDATPDHWWKFANENNINTDNFQLRSLTTPYYDISPHGVETAKGLLNRMDYILDQSCFTPTLLKFFDDVRWPKDDLLKPRKKHKVKSASHTAKERINNDTVYEFLLSKNKLDIELYEWAKPKATVVCADIPPPPPPEDNNHTSTAEEEQVKAADTTTASSKKANSNNNNNNNQKKNNSNSNKNKNNNNNSTETVVGNNDNTKNNKNPTPVPVPVAPTPVPTQQKVVPETPVEEDEDTATTSTGTADHDDTDEEAEDKNEEEEEEEELKEEEDEQGGGLDSDNDIDVNNESNIDGEGMAEEEEGKVKVNEGSSQDGDDKDDDDYNKVEEDEAVVVHEGYYLDYLLVFVAGFLIRMFYVRGFTGRNKENHLVNAIKSRINNSTATNTDGDASEKAGLISSPSNKLEP